ncbi:MAG TPA: hypothetical protein PKY59_23715 [Pyrinomonadaceae bacterium]|nr:hypothetical protein [Pyrinomonadaceae bacterium]
MKEFIDSISRNLSKIHKKFDDFYDENNIVHKRLFSEYGAIYAAGGDAVAPDRIVFKDETEVSEFQSKISIKKAQIGEFELELQTSAMNELLNAVVEAEANGLTLNPRGKDSARRNYEGTIELWLSRVIPALEFWTNEGKISFEEAEKIRQFPPFQQVPEVFKLEEQEIWFSKDLSKSIIYSVAPPGTSQHLAMLAFDVAEFQNPSVREILAKHKWFQTVVSDLPHFTFLGVEETELPNLGLKKIENHGQTFWIPDI